MKKRILFSFLTSAALLTCAAVAAQDFNTGYFLGNYPYSYKLNPAMHPVENTNVIVGVGVGDIAVKLGTNVGYSSFFFPKNGEMVFALNEKVTKEEFLGGLPDLSKANLNADIALLTVGFPTKFGYLTLDARFKDNLNADITKDVFTMLKSDLSTKTGAIYNLGSFSLNGKGYFEIAADYSIKIGDFRVGAALKGLLGIVTADLRLNNMKGVIADGGKIKISGDGSISAASAMLTVPTTASGTYDFSKISFNKPAFGGFGFGVDLGVDWTTPVEGLSASFAILDLGFIRWKESIKGTVDIKDEEVSTDIGFSEYINKLFKLNANGVTPAYSESLSPTFNIGAKYKMPFYQRLQAGFHGTFTTGATKYFDTRLGLNVTPVNPISVAVSAGINKFGPAFGTALNFRLGPICLYGGVDGYITKFSVQGIPVNPLNTVMKLGLVIATQPKKK